MSLSLHEHEPLRVIARPATRNRKLNPYNALLYDAMRAQGVRVSEYCGGRWLWSRHDVLHVHWPESVFNHGLFGALAVTRTLLEAMDWLRRRGTRCVWTVHNLAAHERRYPEQERRFLQAFTRRLDGFFVLDDSGLELARNTFPELRARPGFVVPHPHYRDAYASDLSRRQARALLGVPAECRVVAFLGQILEYKNVVELVRVFRSTPDPELRLLIAGQPRTAALAAAIERTAAGDGRILRSLRYVPPHRVQHYLRAADLVALPYREILNSGSAMLALSFDRPVLMPESPAAAALRGRMPPGWVLAYDALSPDTLHRALERAAQLPEHCTGVWRQMCAPATIAAATVAAYRQLLAAPFVRRENDR